MTVIRYCIWTFLIAFSRMSKGRTFVIVTIIVIALIVAVGLGIGLGLQKDKTDDDTTATTNQPEVGVEALLVAPSVSKEGKYRFATVAADAAECSKIGTEIMAAKGGSAVDAAIAGILCVCVHNMHSCGIGGGHVATYYNRSDKNAYSIIAREQAPSGASKDMYKVNGTSSQRGGLAIGIPGEIRGLYELYKLGGWLPWKQLFQPTISLCRKGFLVGEALLQGFTGKEQFYDEFPSFRDFIHDNTTGEIYKATDIIRLPKLADTLEIIANEGPDAFYNGSLTQNIFADIKDAGGIITESDLANYTALVQEPIISHMKDNRTVYSPRPPSSGVVYQFILNILDGFNMDQLSVATVEMATVTWHRIIEAFKHAYALRTQLGDPNVGTESFKDYIKDLITNMTDSDFGESKRALIDDTQTFGSDYYNPSFKIEWDHGTAHLSVLGPNGDAVSMTSTINLHFGSKVIGSRTGIIFNNEMDDFSTPGTVNFFGVPASPANFIAPWKRPLSSMCPSIVVDGDGDVELVVGASGGTRITTSTALVTIESLWFRWDIKQSIDYPRVHHQLFPTTTNVQETFPEVLIDGLRSLGHNITMKKSASSVVQGIKVKDGTITSNSDYRKHGEPDGY